MSTQLVIVIASHCIHRVVEKTVEGIPSHYEKLASISYKENDDWKQLLDVNDDTVTMLNGKDHDISFP